MRQYFEENNLSYPGQSGVREVIAVTFLLKILVVGIIIWNLESVCLVFMDLKDFDYLVGHEILFTKLSIMEFKIVNFPSSLKIRQRF